MSVVRQGFGSRLRSVRLTWRGAVYIVAASAAFVAASRLGQPGLLWVSGLLVGVILAACALLVFTPLALGITRQLSSSTVEIGEPLRVRLLMTHRSALTLHWRDELPWGWTGRSAGIGPAALGRKSEVDVQHSVYEAAAGRRGRYVLGPITMERTDPLGVLIQSATVEVSDHIVVLPHRELLTAGFVSEDTSDEPNRSALVASDVTEEDVMPRPYRDGDAFNRLHWKATAHRGELMVRQEDRQQRPRALLILDVTRQAYPGDLAQPPNRSPQFEWGVVAAASIAQELLGRGYEVELSAGDVNRIIDGQAALLSSFADLADISPDGAQLEGPRQADRQYAILGRISLAVAHQLVDDFALSGQVRAFVDAQSPPGAISWLTDHGWRCVAYQPEDDLATRWSELSGGRH